jgi:long-chain acyl-CoA synthetase
MESPDSHTILSLYQRRVNEDAAQPAIHVRDGGHGRACCWSELDSAVRRAAVALVSLELQPGDRVLQLSENRYEWIVGDLAIQCAGGVHVPVHASLTGQQVVAQIVHSGAQIVLVSGPEQAAKLATCTDRLPDDLQVFSYDPCAATLAGRTVPLWDDRLPRGLGRAEIDDLLDRRFAAVTPDSLATILYTSGTMGEPKGVMLSQRNLAFNACAAVQTTGETSADVKLCFLPLSHIFARTCDLYKTIVAGGQLALAQSRQLVLADCAALGPTWINGVPYFFDHVRRELCRQGRERDAGGLRALLGGRIQTCHVGGAPVSRELYEFYWSRGVPLYTGYGLTESSPVIAVSNPQHARWNAVGKPLAGTEVRIAGDGEILARGPHVMQGYWSDPAGTADALRDGWLHTGDLGRLDDDGFLCLTGRKKELIVTTGGKKIAPALVESLLIEDPLIEQVLVVGDGRDYLAALIVPHRPALRAELAACDADAPAATPTTTVGPPAAEIDLCDPRVTALYAGRIRQRLAALSHYEQVGRFVLVDRPFALERGEVTAKQSLRRAVIVAHFAKEIERLYGPAGP